MKFLFSQNQLFVPEKFGQVIFTIEKREKTPSVSEREVDINIDNLDSKVDKTVLKEEIERNKEVLQKAKGEGDQISDIIKTNILRELPGSKARTLTVAQYGRRIDDIGKRSQGAINHWVQNYGKVMPDGWIDNLKIGAVVGTIAYGDTKGNMLGRLKNASKWAAGAAVLAHPAITGGLAGLMSFTGKTVLAPTLGVGIPNLIFTLIDNPSSLMRAIKKSGGRQTSIASTPIYELLTTGRTQTENLAKDLQTGSQDAFELRTKGMVIGDTNLNNVMNEIELYENYQKLGQPRTFPSSGITSAATFILQVAEHTLNDVELFEFRRAMWNKEASPAMIRRVLATNAEKDVLKFFEDNGMMSQLTNEMNAQRQKGKTSPTDLSKMFIDGTVEAGSPEFTGRNEKKGIRRFLSMGGGGMALALYAIAFLSVTGVMKVQDLAHPDFWKKKAPNTLKAPFRWVGSKWESFKKLFKKSPMKALSGMAKDKKWANSKERKAIMDLNKSDRKTIKTRFETFSNNKDAVYKNKVKEAKKLKGKEKRETLKKLKEQKVEMGRSQFESMFDGVSSKGKENLTFLSKK